MKTNRDLLLKGIKHAAWTVVLMFAAPYVLYQAFKNEDHSFYIPVLIVGIILAFMAIAMGFYSVKTMTDAFFGVKPKNK